MARKTDRNFLVDFAALDIEYLPEKGPEVSSDIQMVYVMGNVAPAAAFEPGWDLPSPIPISYSTSANIGVVAGERGRVELLAAAGGRGLWVMQVTGVSALEDVVFFTIGALTGLAVSINPTAANSSAFGTGADATAVIDFGTSLVAAPATAWRSNIGSNTNARTNVGVGSGPIYIAAGRVFVCQMVAIANAITLGIQWREVP